MSRGFPLKAVIAGLDRRAITLAFLLLFVLGTGGVHAQSSEPSAYKVDSGDVLAVTVFGEAALTGEFPVGPNGTIAYPIVGSVAAAGRTPLQITASLAKALGEHIPNPAVTVAIARYAPVFVLGDVQTPGSYEYRPGMIALELVALGGGIRRSPDASETGRVPLIAARQEYTDVELQIFASNARRARVQAEFRDVAFDPPAELDEPDPAIQGLKESMLKGEKMLFDTRETALESQRAALLAQEKSYADEIDTVTESMKLHDQEIALLLEDVAAQQSLVDRGLSAKSNLREVQRSLSATRRDALELGSYLARARQNKLAIAQRRAELKETRRNEAAAELQTLDLELARMRGRQSALRETINELSLLAGGKGLAPGGVEPTYTVLRHVDGALQEIASPETVGLEPGDILRVAFPVSALPRQASLD